MYPSGAFTGRGGMDGAGEGGSDGGEAGEGGSDGGAGGEGGGPIATNTRTFCTPHASFVAASSRVDVRRTATALAALDT